MIPAAEDCEVSPFAQSLSRDIHEYLTYMWVGMHAPHLEKLSWFDRALEWVTDRVSFGWHK